MNKINMNRHAIVAGFLLVLSIFLMACASQTATVTPPSPTARPPEVPVAQLKATPLGSDGRHCKKFPSG